MICKLCSALKEHTVKVIYRPLNPTPEEARHTEENRADLFVRIDRGGTLTGYIIGTFTIVPLIVDSVKHIPVVAAGGIADHRSFIAALALSAEGVLCIFITAF